jgi:hypothetical protein
MANIAELSSSFIAKTWQKRSWSKKPLSGNELYHDIIATSLSFFLAQLQFEFLTTEVLKSATCQYGKEGEKQNQTRNFETY